MTQFKCNIPLRCLLLKCIKTVIKDFPCTKIRYCDTWVNLSSTPYPPVPSTLGLSLCPVCFFVYSWTPAFAPSPGLSWTILCLDVAPSISKDKGWESSPPSCDKAEFTLSLVSQGGLSADESLGSAFFSSLCLTHWPGARVYHMPCMLACLLLPAF